MKKIIALVFAFCMLIMNTGAFAQEVSVNLNGSPVSFDVVPFVEESYVLVPVRGIFEAIGANVSWDGETQTVIVSYLKDSAPAFIVLQINNATAFVNSEQKDLGMPAKIVGNRTFVPVGFILDALGESAEWNEQDYTVNITQ